MDQFQFVRSTCPQPLNLNHVDLWIDDNIYNYIKFTQLSFDRTQSSTLTFGMMLQLLVFWWSDPVVND